MTKTNFGPETIVTSKFLNGAQQIHFDGADEDWHYPPINIGDIDDSFSKVFVTIDTKQDILAPKVFHDSLTDAVPPAPIGEEDKYRFTSPVVGVTPIHGSHLTTKKYVDEEIYKNTLPVPLLNIGGGVEIYKDGGDEHQFRTLIPGNYISINQSNSFINIEFNKTFNNLPGGGESLLVEDSSSISFKRIKGSENIEVSSDENNILISGNYLSAEDLIEGNNITLENVDGGVRINSNFELQSSTVIGESLIHNQILKKIISSPSIEVSSDENTISFNLINSITDLFEAGNNINFSLNEEGKTVINAELELENSDSFGIPLVENGRLKKLKSDEFISLEERTEDITIGLEKLSTDLFEAGKNIEITESNGKIKIDSTATENLFCNLEEGNGISIDRCEGNTKISSTLDNNISQNDFIAGNDIDISELNGKIKIDSTYNIENASEDWGGIGLIRSSKVRRLQAGNNISLYQNNGSVTIEASATPSINSFSEGQGIEIEEQDGKIKISSNFEIRSSIGEGFSLITNEAIPKTKRLIEGDNVSLSSTPQGIIITADTLGFTASNFIAGNDIQIDQVGEKIRISSSFSPSLDDFLEGNNIYLENESEKIKISSYEILGGNKISSSVDDINNSVTLDFDGLTADDFNQAESSGISISDSANGVVLSNTDTYDLAAADFDQNNSVNVSFSDTIGGVSIIATDSPEVSDFIAGNDISVTDEAGKVRIDSTADTSISASDFVEGTNISISDEVGGVQIASYDIVGGNKISSVVDNTNNNVTLDFDGLGATDFEAGNGISITDSSVSGKYVKIENIADTSISASDFVEGTNISISDEVGGVQIASYDIVGGNKISSVVDNTNKNVTLDFDGLTAADFEAGNGISITNSSVSGKYVKIDSTANTSISASDFVEGTNISITDEVGGVQIASYDIVGGNKISSVIDNTNNNVTLDFGGLTAADFEAGNGISITDSSVSGKYVKIDSTANTSISASDFVEGTNISITDEVGGVQVASYDIVGGNKISSTVDNTNDNVTLDFDGLDATDFEAGNGISITNSSVSGKYVKIDSTANPSISASDFVEGTNVSISDEVGGVQITSYDMVGGNKISSVIDNTNNNVTLDFDGLDSTDFEAGNGISITDSSVSGKYVKIENTAPTTVSANDFTEGNNVSISDNADGTVNISAVSNTDSSWNNYYEDGKVNRKVLTLAVSDGLELTKYRTDGDNNTLFGTLGTIPKTSFYQDKPLLYQNRKLFIIQNDDNLIYKYVDGSLEDNGFWGGPFAFGKPIEAAKVSKENGYIYTLEKNGSDTYYELVKYKITKTGMTESWRNTTLNITKRNLIVDHPTEEKSGEMIYVILEDINGYDGEIQSLDSNGNLQENYPTGVSESNIIDFDITIDREVIVRLFQPNNAIDEWLFYVLGTSNNLFLGTINTENTFHWWLSREDYMIRVYSNPSGSGDFILDIVRDPSINLGTATYSKIINAINSDLEYDPIRGLFFVNLGDRIKIYSVLPKEINFIDDFLLSQYNLVGGTPERFVAFYSYPRDYSRTTY